MSMQQPSADADDDDFSECEISPEEVAEFNARYTSAVDSTLAASASGSSDDGSRCLLLKLSHKELGVIVDGLADPLEPVVAVALSSTCLGLRTPLKAALEVLQQRHGRAKALCCRWRVRWEALRLPSDFLSNCTCKKLRDWWRILNWTSMFATGTWRRLGCYLFHTNGLLKLHTMTLSMSGLSDAGVQALCEGLGNGAAPSLSILNLADNQFGPAGAEAFAAALRRGAMPKLETLYLSGNDIGNQGAAALATPLRKLPSLKSLHLAFCGIGAEGVASLFANIGKDDFEALNFLSLYDDNITHEGCNVLIAEVDGDAVPSLARVEGLMVSDAIARAGARLAAGIKEGTYTIKSVHGHNGKVAKVEYLVRFEGHGNMERWIRYEDIPGGSKHLTREFNKREKDRKEKEAAEERKLRACANLDRMRWCAKVLSIALWWHRVRKERDHSPGGLGLRHAQREFEYHADTMWVDGILTSPTPTSGMPSDGPRGDENGLEEWVHGARDSEQPYTCYTRFSVLNSGLPVQPKPTSIEAPIEAIEATRLPAITPAPSYFRACMRHARVWRRWRRARHARLAARRGSLRRWRRARSAR